MLRKLLLMAILLAWVCAPLRAQSPLPTRTQLENQRDLLQRYSARLMEVNDRYQVFQKILDLASQDQLDAIKALRISPTQAMDLLKVLQQNMPSGPMDDAAMKALQKTVQPQMEQILGPDQFDLVLQLFPTPQQKAQAEAIMAEAANTPEGQAAYQAAQELSAALTPDQRSFLQPYLDLAKAPTAGAAEPTLGPSTAPATAPTRNFVNLRRTGAGDFFADVNPDQNYLAHLPRSYRVVGGDPNLMAAVATSSGIPARLLGTVDGDRLFIATTSLLGAPPLLAIGGGGQVWHGKLPAHVVGPNTVELDAGRGQKITAVLEMDSKQQQAFQAAGTTFMVEGTCYMGSDNKNTLYDVTFSPWQEPRQSVQAAALCQVSEEFFNHCATEYLNGHRDQLSFGGPNDKLKFRVTDVGLTLSGCQPNQARVFVMGVLSHSGLDVLSAQVELTGQVALSGTNLSLTPVPGTLQMRINYPLFAQAPASWGTNLENIMGAEYAKGFSFAMPADYQDKLVKTGFVTADQVNGVKTWTLPTEDRRTALVALTMPATTGTALNVLASRIQAPGECVVVVPEQTINDVIKNQIPGKMPIMIDVPENLQEQQGGVKFKQIEVAELDVVFTNGVFKINNCVLNVHWRYGIFAGVEPGIKFSGTATLASAGTPTQVVGKLAIDQLTFLSPHILAMTQAEQDDIKAKLLKAVADYNLPLAENQQLAIPALSSQANLVPTGAGGTASPSELLIQGGLIP